MPEPVSRLSTEVGLAIEKAVSDNLRDVIADVHSIKRTLVGEPEEGNEGLLKRMERTESRVAKLVWLLPVWVTVGTGGGQLLVRWIGL